MLKLVDKPDLGSGAERRMGSIPFARTKREPSEVLFFRTLIFHHIQFTNAVWIYKILYLSLIAVFMALCNINKAVYNGLTCI